MLGLSSISSAPLSALETAADTISVLEGRLVLTGASVYLNYSGVIEVEPAALTLTGAAVDLNVTYLLTVVPGELVLAGEEVEVLAPTSEVFTLNLIVDLLPAENLSNYQRYSERLTVDGQELKVISWNYDEPPQSLTGSLNINLADVGQRSLITKDSEITFELLTWNGVDFDSTTLLSTGYLDKSDYGLSRQGIGAAHSFTFTALPEMAARLNKVPSTTIIYYNPDRHTVTADDFEGLYLEDGTYVSPVVNSGGTDLYSLLNLVYVTQCGFLSVNTNIPNYTLGIVEFPAGAPYVGTINGIIGMFEPDYTVVDTGAGLELWIRDGTAGSYPDFPSPRQIGVRESQSIGVATEIKRVDSVQLRIQQERYTFDLWEERVENTTASSGDNPPFPDLYVTTDIETVYRDFYRLSKPDTPIKTESKRVTRTARQNGFTTIRRDIEDFTYDGMGRLVTRYKTVDCLLPDPDNDFDFDLIRCLEEQEKITYRPHPYEARQYYIAQREINTAGLIFIDGDNQQLGEDYSRSAIQANISGSVVDSMTGDWDKISTYQEVFVPQRNRKVKIQISSTDYLVKPNGHHEYSEEIRDGEVGMSIFTVEQQTRTIYREGQSEILGNVKQINCGELPLNTALALGHRVLDNDNGLPNLVSHNLIGIDTTLQKGTPVNAVAFDTDGSPTDLGNYQIEGRRMSGSRQGYSMQITCRQTE